MKNEKTQNILMIVLGAVIALFAVLLIISLISSGSSSVKVEDVTSQNSKNSYVNSYALGNYYTDGSKETKGEAQPSEAPKTNTNKGDYILEKSASSPLTDDDMKGLSAQELTYARNEIYARYGRPFQSSELKQYFQSKSWYRENPSYNDSMVSPLEEDNANKIADYQARNNLQYNPQ